jgi:hypothetical protein
MSSSTQNQYSGQGWNDCAPSNFVEPLSKPGSRSASRSSTRKRSLYIHADSSTSSVGSRVVSENSSLPTPLTTPLASPPSSAINVEGQQSEKVNGDHLSDGGVGISTSGEETTVPTYDLTSASSQSVLALLDRVLNLPTSLPSREFDQYKSRMHTVIPELDPTHLDAVNRSFEQVLDNHKDAAREIVVQHSLYHMGISSWVLPLRNLIESVQA